VSVGNSMSGTAGNVLQAHSITGDVHVHAASPALPRPRQLPALTPGFAGRDHQITELNSVLGDHNPGTVVISAIAGTAGIGKTTLALYWAHHAQDRFPDGQLYVNLQGFAPSGAPMQPAEALRGFLNAFEVPVGTIPADLEALSALYRSLVAGRRMLIVLDNARDVEQIRPLLPGSPTCAVVVTSRNRLTGLAAREGARLIQLDVLSEPEARALLTHRLGARVEAEPDAVASLIQSCGRLPLALAIVAARGAADPDFPLDVLAGELRDERDRLAALNAGDPSSDMRAVISWSYRSLTPEAASLFRCLGAHPGPEISLDAASALAGTEPVAARWVLDELTRANLVENHVPGRYRFHDLLRLYARHLADDSGALERILRWYRDRVAGAVAWIDPRVAADRYLGTRREAMQWLELERNNLVAAVVESGDSTLAAEIACLLSRFLRKRRHYDDWLHTLSVAAGMSDETLKIKAKVQLCLAKAEIHGTDVDVPADIAKLPPAEYADALGFVAKAYLLTGRAKQALATAQENVRAQRGIGNRRGEAWALTNLAETYRNQLLFDETTECLDQALAIWRESGDLWFEADVLVRTSRADRMRSHIATAISCLDQALSIYESFGDPVIVASTMNHRASILRQYGAHVPALEALRTAHRILIDAGELREEIDVLDELILTAQDLGRTALCREYLDRLTTVADALHDPEAVLEALFTRAKFHSAIGDHRSASADLRECQAQAAGMRAEISWRAARNLGRAYSAQGRIDDAVRTFADFPFTRSTVIFALEHPLTELMWIYQEAGRYTDAIPCATSLIDRCREFGDAMAECVMLDNLSQIHNAASHYRQAIAASERALDIRSTMGVDTYRQGWGLAAIADAHWNAGRFDDARTFIEQVLVVRQEAGNQYGVVQALGSAAVLHVCRREFTPARERLAEVLALSTSDMLDPALPMLTALVHVYIRQYRFSEAEECYRLALPTVLRLGQAEIELDLQRLAAQARIKAGHATDGIELLRYHLDRKVAVGDFAAAASLRSDIVLALLGQRRFAEAAILARRGLDDARQRESINDEVLFAGLLGETHRGQDQFAEAQRHYQAAVDLCDRHGSGAKGAYLAELAKTHLDAGEVQQAVAVYRTRLEAERKLGDDQLTALAMAELAGAAARAGNRIEARELLDSSVAACRRLENPWDAALTFGKCARAAQELDDSDRAVEYFTEQAAISRRVYDLPAQAEALSDLGEHYLARNQLSDALDAHEQSLAVRTELEDQVGIKDQLRKLEAVKAAIGD
jgi:tetratricopeptide (TPR) repeat protein